MKYRIHNDFGDGSTVTLKLEHEMGGVYLMAVNDEGKLIEQGVILQLTPEGKLFLFEGLNPGLDFQQDERGKIALA